MQANEIKEKLKFLGWTQVSLSKEFGCSPQQIYSAINTTQQPTLRFKIEAKINEKFQEDNLHPVFRKILKLYEAVR